MASFPIVQSVRVTFPSSLGSKLSVHTPSARSFSTDAIVLGNINPIAVKKIIPKIIDFLIKCFARIFYLLI